MKITLTAAVYPQPYCWEKPPEEQKTYHIFEVSDEGLDAAVEWLNEAYAANEWE